MSRIRTLAALVGAIALTSAVQAEVVAHWRFEQGAFLSDSGPNGIALSALGKQGLPEQHKLPVGFDPGSEFPRTVEGKLNNMAAAGRGKTQSFNHRQLAADLSAHDDKLTAGFTIEAFVNLSYSHVNDNAVLIGRGMGAPKGAAWVLSVTGANSDRGTRNVLFQTAAGGQWIFENIQTLQSELFLELGKDYYIAVSADFTRSASQGITVYLKDLTDSGAQLQVTTFASIQSVAATDLPLVIGANPAGGTPWYGLIDEVRISDKKLPESELLINTAGGGR